MRITATDGQLTSKTEFIVTVNPVNDAPVATNGSFSINEDTPYSGSLIGNDVEGSALTFSIVSQGAKGTATITNAATGAFTYTPKVNANGSDSFNFKVNDGLLNSTIATMTVSILPVNDAPVALNNTLMTNEDTDVAGTLGATDVDGDALTFSILTNGSKGIATITNAATGAFTYKTIANMSGIDTFTFKANDGKLDSNTATITVTINEVNDVPIAVDGPLNVIEDIPVNGLLPFTHPDTHATTFTILQNGAKGVVTLTNSATGAYTYAPNTNTNGTDFFTFKVNDEKGESNTATISVTIKPVNDAPISKDGTLTIQKNSAGSAVLSATDVDSTTLTFSIVTNGSQGVAVITNPATGAYTYTPTTDATGTDPFTFKVNDGEADSNTSTMTVTINDTTSTAPIANNGVLVLDEDKTGIGTLTSINTDGDVDYVIVTNGEKGTATITDAKTGAYTYIPNANTNGKDSFTFKVNTSKESFNTATISVTINSINDAPVAEETTLRTNEDVVASGALRASDIDGDTLTYTLVTNGSKGVATLLNPETGFFTYTPNLDANGEDSFTFKANDGKLESNTATIIVTINPVNDVPIATQNISFTIMGGKQGTIGLSGTDADGDTMNYVIQSLSLNGKLYQTADGMTLGNEITATGTTLTNANGRVIYVQNAGWTGKDTFNFVVKDATSSSSSTAVTITVQAKPEISPIPNLSVKSGQTPIIVPFSVLNKEQATGKMTFLTKSWNAGLILDANIQVVENGNQYNLIITPIAKKSGSAFITVTLKDDTDSFTVNFTLTIESEETMISGVVKNAAGVGVAGVMVRFQPEFDAATGNTGTWGETFTDANGNYSFEAMPGKYRIEFMTSYNKSGANVTLAGNLVGGFANGTGGTINDWNDASLLQVTDATQIDVTLETGVTLSGTVKKIGGTPIPGAEVNVHSKDWSLFFHTKTNSSGAFSVMVNPGLEYQVDVWPAYCDTGNTAVEQGCGPVHMEFQGGHWITPQDSLWVSGWKADDNTTQPLVVASTVANGTDVFGTVMGLSDDHMVTNIKLDKSINISVLVDSGISVQGRVLDSTDAAVPYAWVDTPFGSGPTNQAGYFTINLPSTSGATSGMSTFAIKISPSGHVDPDTHKWIQGTNFIGGVVIGDATNGFLLSGDDTKAVQFKAVVTDWPSTDLLGDANQKGLLVRVSGGISITGTIQDGTGQKLANMWVNTWSHDISFGAGASTNSDGNYSILVPTPTPGTPVWYEVNLWSDRYLVPEPVLVKVQSNGVVGVYQIDKTQSTQDNSGLLKPIAGAVIQENSNGNVSVNFTLTTGNTISGRVVDANNNGKPWTWVDIHSKDGSKWYGANTDENGYYKVTVSPANDYIGVIWGGNGQYRTTFYKNTGREEDATLINAVGGNVEKIDFMLGSGAKISGTITGLPSGKKVWVNVWSESENSMGGVEVTGNSTNTASFSITGLASASDYRLDWRSNSEEIPSGFYGGVLGGTASGPKKWEQAILLSTLNGNVTGVAIDLASVSTKTLTIKIDGLTAGAKVDANLRSEKLDKGVWKQVTATSTEATLVLKGVDSSGDDYRLFIGGPNATFKVGNFKGEVSATSYPIAAGTLVGFDQATLINMSSNQFVYLTVSNGRQLTVTVAGLKSGQKAWVDAFSETTGAWGGGEVKYVDGTTDKVVIKGLQAADDYRVSIWGDKIQGGSYAGTGKAPGSWDTAELVDLTTADSSISMTVSTGRSISGTVSGLKIKESAWMDAWSNSTYSWGGKMVQAGGSGSDSYTIAGVGQATDFKVKFDAFGYVPQSQSGVDTTTQDATEVNFTASTGGSITGSITGLNAFEWVKIDAWSPAGDFLIVGGVSANSQGAATYTLTGVPAATDYVVGLWRGNKGLFYATSGITPIWDNHTAVTVTGSGATNSINFDLTAAGNLFYTLSGTVSGLTSDQVVEIRAWSETAGASTSISGNGSFKLEGLPSGNYTVEVTSNGYAPQHTDVVTVSNGVVSSVTWSTGWNRSGTVAVTTNTNGLNVIISKGYFIKGTVTNNGNAVSGALVNAWSANDFVGGSATTNSKGEFMIKGLPNLTYSVDVWTPEGSATKEVIMNGVNQSDVALMITKAGGSISGKVTTKNGGVAGGALILAYDAQGTEKKRVISDSKTGTYTLDGLNPGDTYTVKTFSAAKTKSGTWTTDSGYATGTVAATSAGATLDLVLN